MGRCGVWVSQHVLVWNLEIERTVLLFCIVYPREWKQLEVCADAATLGVGTTDFTLSWPHYLKYKAIFPALWTQVTNPKRIE